MYHKTTSFHLIVDFLKSFFFSIPIGTDFIKELKQYFAL